MFALSGSTVFPLNQWFVVYVQVFFLQRGPTGVYLSAIDFHNARIVRIDSHLHMLIPVMVVYLPNCSFVQSRRHNVTNLYMFLQMGSGIVLVPSTLLSIHYISSRA